MLYKKKSIINVPRGILLAKNPNSYTDMLRCALWFSHQHASFRLRPHEELLLHLWKGIMPMGTSCHWNLSFLLLVHFSLATFYCWADCWRWKKNMHMENCVWRWFGCCELRNGKSFVCKKLGLKLWTTFVTAGGWFSRVWVLGFCSLLHLCRLFTVLTTEFVSNFSPFGYIRMCFFPVS